MSESIWCSVSVKIPTTWEDGHDTPPFLQDLSEALINGDSADRIQWSEPTGTPGEYVTHVQPGCWQVTGEGNYGLADEDVQTVLEWCHEHRVPYIATSDAKYEFDGEWYLFDGFTHYDAPRAEGGCYMTRQIWESVTTGQSVIYPTVEAFWKITGTDINDVSIDHLGAEYADSIDVTV